MGNGDFFKLQRLLPSGILSFLNLCKTRSYTKTAKELHTSQSSVSRSIVELESSLGFQLIERDTRPIKITQAGLLLRQSLLNCQDILENVLLNIQESNFTHLPLRIGFIESMLDCFTKPLLINLRSAYSNALVLTAVSTQLLKLLDEDRLDFIVSSNPFSQRNDLKRCFLFQEPSVIILPKSLKIPEPMTWDHLKYCGLPQISHDKDSSGAFLEDRLFSENGLNFVHQLDVNSNSLIVEMVAERFGWSLTRVSSLIRFPQFFDKISVRQMPDPLTSREIFLIYKKDVFSPMAQKIAKEIRQIIDFSLVPRMLHWAPWIKPYLFVQGEGPLDRVALFPEEHPDRLISVL